LNREEEHNWFFNLWFCFFFPLTCRIKPLRNDDICDVADDELCEKNYKKARNVWVKLFQEYVKKQKDFETAVLLNPKSDLLLCCIFFISRLKPPSRPSLFRVITLTMSDSSLILAAIYLFLQYLLFFF
jgi:hypothetical protein